MSQKLSEIKKFLNENGFSSNINLNESETNTIYELIQGKNAKSLDILTKNEIFIYGVYFSIIKNYDEMIKYYLISIDNGYYSAMNNLGQYYYKIDDIDNMLKYHLMAIENGSICSITNLGCYYETINDIDNMLKYYLMGIEKGSSNAMVNLAGYYERINEIDNMLKYHLMAINKGNSIAMNNLGYYYGKINNIDNMLKYHLMAIENNINNKHKNQIIDNANKIIKLPHHLMFFRKYLNEKNLRKLNKYISFYLEVSNNSSFYELDSVLIKECIICYDNKHHIIFPCSHSVCYTCYKLIENCPLCRITLK